MAALAAAAVLASTVLASTITSLAARVADGSGAGSATAAGPAWPASPGPAPAGTEGSNAPADSSASPAGTTADGHGSLTGGPGVANGTSAPTQTADPDERDPFESLVEDAADRALDRVLGPLFEAAGESDNGYEAPPLDDVGAAALALIEHQIDRGDDLGMSEGELDNVRDMLEQLDPEQREAVLGSLSDLQLERLFHNVHSSGFWSNDWNDKERNHFYGLLSELPKDLQQRLSSFTDYFELYDSGLDPSTRAWPEEDYVAGYEAIMALDLDEFLALRAYMWDHPELIEQSPFDWYADGCSIPGGHYPGALNGPCLAHDFAYTNAKLATYVYAKPSFTDLSGDGPAEEWKQNADQRLRDDIAELPWWKTGDSEMWAGIVYTGVAVDFDAVGLPSGRAAFTDTWALHYGPGFDPNLGQWSDEESESDRMQELVEIATMSGQP